MPSILESVTLRRRGRKKGFLQFSWRTAGAPAARCGTSFRCPPPEAPRDTSLASSCCLPGQRALERGCDVTVSVHKSRLALAILFIGAGIAHFVRPQPYIGIMPDWIPAHALMVALSGVGEIAGGVGILVRRSRRAAGIGLIVLLVAVFPANIQMLINGIHDARPWWYQAALWLRLPLQPLLVWWIVKATQRRD